MFLPWSGPKLWIVLAISSIFLFQRREASSCSSDKCGDFEIPFPFGIGDDCSLSQGFTVNCSSTGLRAQAFSRDMEISSINLESSKVEVMIPVAYQCYNSTGRSEISNYHGVADLQKTPYTISYEDNVFIAVGCDTEAYIYDSVLKEKYWGGCISWCESFEEVARDSSCTGTSCCQSSIKHGMKNYSVDFGTWRNHREVLGFNPCSYGFIVKKNTYSFSTSDLNLTLSRKFPLVLDWTVGNLTCEEAKESKVDYACVAENSDCHELANGGEGYVCKCSKGYNGNPYLQNGCKDIDECKDDEIRTICKGDCRNTNGSYECTCPQGTTGNATGDGCHRSGFSNWTKIGLGIGVGLPLLFLVGLSLLWVIQRRKLRKLRQELFRRNGGLFLQEQISKHQTTSFKIFTMAELEKATNKFDEERILGRGGNGIVYKGIILQEDETTTTVAIKKSLVVEECKSKEFANEMLILSKINHVNVVKLLGCCLEVDVPMLVYEYIANGTLFEKIHSGEPEHRRMLMSWDLRLRIGAQSAKALSYLHSEASPPILHGDIKSANILLDDNFTAKVSDFGTSTFAPKDKSRFMTLIQGTYGYLDPEYLQTGELTDKSDVYSFGVVMVELLTGKKPIYRDNDNKERNLVSEFLTCLKEGRLLEILDRQIRDDNIKEIELVADVVKQCLSITGEERPTMTYVSMVLTKQHPWTRQQNTEEMEPLLPGLLRGSSFTSPSNLNNDEFQSITSTSEVELRNVGRGR